MEWISVRDRLPKDQEVKVLLKNGDVLDGYYCDDVDASWWSDYFETHHVGCEVTHWMPLYFKTHPYVRPIRQHRFEEYKQLLTNN